MNQTKELLLDYIAETRERLKPLPANISSLDGFHHPRIHTRNLFEYIVQRYNTTSLPTHTDEDVFIETALKRNGLDELIRELKIRKTEFFNDF